MELKFDSLIKRNEQIISSEIDGETVMMDLNFEKYFGMEAIGTRIWQLLENETSLTALCEKLTEEFEVGMEQCMEDVLPFVSDLSENGIIIVN
jgi:hypothetical protein